MARKADVAVIGGGMGGYVAALRAEQLGAKVILMEKEKIGGVCLNWGCIPTKALLYSAEVLSTAREAATFGVMVGEPRLDWAAVQAHKQKVVDRLVRGVNLLLERAGIEVLKGHARFLSPRLIEVDLGDGKEQIEARNTIVASGSSPISLPIPSLDHPNVLDSTGALSLAELPESLLIIGGGAIGVEFATLFSALGVKVTIVEMLSRLVPTADHDIGGALERAFKRRRIQFHTEAQVTGVEATADGKLAATVATRDGEQKFEVEKILLAVGRRPNVEDLGLEAAGVHYDRKKGIAVDEGMRTNVPGVYAVGDVVGGAMLAHLASKEGVVAAENAMGGESRMNYKAVPNCIFSDPEAASVGLSEEEARDKGYDLKIGRFPFSANGKALIQGRSDGFVKVVAEAQYGEMLGLHVVGPHASDLILEGGLALNMEATLEEIEATIHAHPTLGEAIAEAALDAQGRVIHMPK